MISIKQDDPIYNVFMKVIKKHNKFQLINKKESVSGNSLAIGNPGYGKTSGNKREVELRYELGHKIFCLYDAGRMDMAYFCFPSVAPFWKIPKLENGKIITSKKYPIELLYPITANIPKKLPFNGVPFTIGVSDLDDNDIVALVGEGAKDTVKGALNFMKTKIDNNTTPLDYLNMMGLGLKKVDDLDNIKPSHFGIKKLKSDVLLPMINEGLLSSTNSDTALDIREKIKDNKTISVLVLRHCPQQLWGFLVYFFLNHIFKILAGFSEERMLKQKTTITMNEAADLLATKDETGSSSGSIKTMIGKIAKQYRTGSLYLVIDSQLPQELPDIKDTLTRLYIYNSSRVEVLKAMEMMGVSSKSSQINEDDHMIIPRLPKGYYYLFDRNEGVSMHKLMLTRSRTYQDGEDFHDIYDNVYGKSSYKSIKEILDKLKQERERSEEIWEQRRNFKIQGQTQRQTQKRKQQSQEEFDEEIDNEEIYEEKIEIQQQKQEQILQQKTTIDVKTEIKKENKTITPTRKITDWAAMKKIMNTI